MSAGTATATIRRSKRGRTIHSLERRLGKFRDVLSIAMPFLPKDIRDAAGPLLCKTKEANTVMEAPEVVDVEQTLKTNMAIRLRANLRTKGFLGRIAWAVKYIFYGVQGGDQ